VSPRTLATASDAIKARGIIRLTMPELARPIDAYAPPGHMTDFDGIPGQRAQWSAAVSHWFDEAIDAQRPVLGTQPCQYYNQLTSDRQGPLVEQVITWNAFPGTLRRRLGRAAALAAADEPLPLSKRMDRPGPYYPGRVWETLYYRPQDEYCEWHVERDGDGRMVRVTFTSEPPEYWQALHGDESPAGGSFTGDPHLLLELYRTYVDERVELADLRCPTDLVVDGERVPLLRRGQYNPYNRWTTTAGIMHLTHPSNTLQAEIRLGADASILNSRDGRLVADPDALIAGAAYGGNNRCSDPTIGANVNHLARLGFALTLNDPVGLYMDHLDMTGWTIRDDDRPIDPSWFRVIRGTGELIERAVFEVPASEGLTISDLRIGGEPIRSGGQLAERMTVKLIGLAAVGERYENDPVEVGYAACADRANPSIIHSRLATQACGPDAIRVFDYPQAITAGRVAPPPQVRDRRAEARVAAPRPRWTRAG
jgi:hypothetical protein